MARRTISPQPDPFDLNKFQSVHQVGGIRTGTIDYPSPSAAGGGQACRVAHVNTGSGLRFTVALDRGGDIVEASFNQHNLAFLTPNGYKPPNHAYHRELDWLNGWPGGLVTTCGPRYIGGPREENGEATSLHGYHSNTPAAVEMIINPDPQFGRHEMLLSMVITDSRMFGPIVEVRRQIQCRLGAPEIVIFDQVTNRGDQRVPHNWLYHVNLGYPLLDEGAKLVFAGKLFSSWDTDEASKSPRPNVERLKRIPAGLSAHAGAGERGVIIDPKPDRDGMAHAGLINNKLKLAVELAFPTEALPRLANWQHFGPNGSYVTGIEPFSGSLVGKANDNHPTADQWLDPGQTKRYHLVIKVHNTPVALKDLAAMDGAVK